MSIGFKPPKVIPNPETAVQWVRSYKNRGLEVVFTNGCFDCLHPGHIFSLEFAKNTGDILIVGLNSDRSIQKIKGPGRPVMDEVSRLKLITALEMVDHVILFEEEDPCELIEKILPDVLVKGEEYKKEEVAGWKVVEANGGKIILHPRLSDHSTTNWISKIQSLNYDQNK